MPDKLHGLPRPRTMVHPGPIGAVRIEHMRADRGRHFRLSLPQGRTLFDAIVDALAKERVGSASMTLLGGELEGLSYCLAQPDSSGRTIAKYGAPQVARGAQFIFGNATLGKAASGSPVVHCHATFRTEDGVVRGGHLLTDRVVVGRVPVTVLVTTLDGFDLRIGVDEETGMPVLRPQPEVDHV